MLDLVIADSSCLIVLTKVDRLELLNQIFDRVLVPPEVAQEYGLTLPDWITIESPTSNSIAELSRFELDPGERAAIALALDHPDATIVIDDLEARRISNRFGLRLTGTLGVLVVAKEMNVIPAILPIIKQIQSTNFHLSTAVIQDALRSAGEL